MSRLRRSAQQFAFLVYELGLMVNGRPWRVWTLLASPAAWTVTSYRTERALHLLLGRAYVLVRPLGLPVFVLLRLLGATHEIHYRASIGRGLKVLHCSPGLVVSGQLVAGEHLTLTGGNVLGMRGQGPFTIGHGVTIGANAVILGPLLLPDDVTVGAGAVVLHSCDRGAILVGVPATDARRVGDRSSAAPS